MKIPYLATILEWRKKMSEKSEKSSEKGILARTATYTTKKARRAQTKVI